MKKVKLLFASGLILILLTYSIFAYKINPTPVHEHITNESKEVWPLIPYEIKLHLGKSINASINSTYDSGDDIVTGSAEEDRAMDTITAFFRNHFFQPDNPLTHLISFEYYNYGLLQYPQSSYIKAREIWTKKVIPLYVKGEIDESYYWLGHVAHLLEDAAQPSHVLDDPHGGHALTGGNSILEEHTGDSAIFNRYNGKNYAGQQYNYDNLINGFTWSNVDPPTESDRQAIELFRLFWYTAQKTQYWASDNRNGNAFYRDLNNNAQNWQCSGTGSLNLWAAEGYTSCSNFINNSADLNAATVDREANATIPHSMRAVAGLYRLFDDAVRIDWPTENHDFRRTGFTLLKGDMSHAKDTEKNSYAFEPGAITDKEQVVKAIVADIDGNGAMEIVNLVSKQSYNSYTKIHTIETQRKSNQPFNSGYTYDTKKKWDTTMVGLTNGGVYFPATLANIDGDKEKELITGVKNGTIYAYDITNGNTITERWRYHLTPKWSPAAGENRIYFDGGTAVVDIDLDGTNEIIFADVHEAIDPNWPGEVYVLKDNGAGVQPTKFANYTFGNGGAYATVSVANLDSDDNPEIVVPSWYGISVFDYDPAAPSKLSLKWSNSDGRIESSAVIADVDADNKYELVYTTNTGSCAAGKTCYNRLYVRDAATGTQEAMVSLSQLPRPTPTVANLDADANLEIVLLTQSQLSGGAVPGNVYCFNGNDGSACTGSWPFNLSNQLKTSFMSPNVADLDNDGTNNVIFAENDGNRVFVLKNDGTELFNYEFEGFIDNGIAIADVDQDGVAELALKRAGSPVTLFSTVSSSNKPPVLEPVLNLTGIAGDLIDIKAAQLNASDPDGNALNLSYSAPFNSTGLWQTTVNDTGNYSILVEVSDGNLTDYKYVDLIVFNENTSVQKSFTDGFTQKGLVYTSPGNQTVRVRLPKNATVIYSKITLRGEKP